MVVISIGLVIVQIRAVVCPSRQYLSFFSKAFSQTILDSSSFSLFHSDQVFPRSGEPRTQKLKSHLVRTQSLNVLPLNSGVGQYIAIHCYAYCQVFIPCLFPHFRSAHLHFFLNLSRFFPVLAMGNTSSFVGPQDKIGHPAWCKFPC